jgi:hypothetical protein
MTVSNTNIDSTNLENARSLVVYTRAILDLKGWHGKIPIASLRRLEQTVRAQRTLDDHDRQAVTSIVGIALSSDSPISVYHRHFFANIADLFSLDLPKEFYENPGPYKKETILILTPQMRIPEPKASTKKYNAWGLLPALKEEALRPILVNLLCFFRSKTTGSTSLSRSKIRF